jgi:hypothetical protein
MQWKRLVYYILINIVVSVCTMLLVLFVWERVRPTGLLDLAAVSLSPSPVATVMVAPTATSTAVPTSPKPTEAYVAYEVKSGETLGEIAQAFGISVEELLEINGRSDPDSVGVGEIWLVPAPTAPSQATAPPAAPDSGSRSSDVTISSVLGAGDLASERVLMRGSGSEEVSLTYWQLKDEDGNSYTFPQLTLFKDGAVNLHTTAGVDTVVDLYWGLAESVWQTGETVTLMDAEGNVRATYQVP